MPKRRALGLLSVSVTVSFGALFYAFSVLITDDAAGAEFSTSALSTAYSGALLVAGSVAYPIGRWADKYGIRSIIGAGALAGSLGLFLYGRAGEPWQIVAISVGLLGPAAGLLFYEPAFVAVDRWFPADRKGRALGVLTVVGGLAGPVFIPLTSWLVSAVGWRDTCTVLALAVLAAAGMAGTVRTPPSHGAAHRDHGGHVEVRTAMRDSRFILFGAGLALSFAAVQALLFHRIAAFEDAGWSVPLVGGLAAVSGLAGLPGRYLAPILSEKVSPATVNAGLDVAMAAAAFFVVGGASVWQLGGHFIVFGVFFGALSPMRAVIMGSWFSGPAYGRIMGAQWSAVALVAAGAPAVVGIGRDGLDSYDLPMVGVGVVLIAAAALTVAAGRAHMRISGAASSKTASKNAPASAADSTSL